jgi:hypothetical protein
LCDEAAPYTWPGANYVYLIPRMTCEAVGNQVATATEMPCKSGARQQSVSLETERNVNYRPVRVAFQLCAVTNKPSLQTGNHVTVIR